MCVDSIDNCTARHGDIVGIITKHRRHLYISALLVLLKRNNNIHRQWHNEWRWSALTFREVIGTKKVDNYCMHRLRGENYENELRAQKIFVFFLPQNCANVLYWTALVYMHRCRYQNEILIASLLFILFRSCEYFCVSDFDALRPVHMPISYAPMQWCGVGVSHLKETPTPGSICFIWTYV